MHRLQGEHLLLRHIWQPPILHMPKVHEMGCGKNKNTNKNGCTANISTTCFFFFESDKIHPRSNIHLQQGHATT